MNNNLTVFCQQYTKSHTSCGLLSLHSYMPSISYSIPIQGIVINNKILHLFNQRSIDGFYCLISWSLYPVKYVKVFTTQKCWTKTVYSIRFRWVLCIITPWQNIEEIIVQRLFSMRSENRSFERKDMQI